MEGTTMNRREAIRSLSFASGASLLMSTPSLAGVLASKSDALCAQALRGTAPVKIRDIKTILTAPNHIRLVVVKVETTEAGLVGWGCATFTQRALAVQTALEDYLKPFLIGRNVDEIEDIWQSSYVSSYWRNGPVLFNAMSGRSEEHTSELQSPCNLVCRLLLEKKKNFYSALWYNPAPQVLFCPDSVQVHCLLHFNISTA